MFKKLNDNINKIQFNWGDILYFVFVAFLVSTLLFVYAYAKQREYYENVIITLNNKQ